MFKILRNFFSDICGNPFFKAGAAAAAAVAVISVLCLVYYAAGAKTNQRLDSEGLALYSEDFPEEYYDNISLRFANQYGETYDEFRLTEGIGISIYGDGGVVDEVSGGYTMPTLLALNYIESFVYIMGNVGETPESIAAKQGGVPMYAEPFEIPSTQTKVKVTLKNEYGTEIIPILKNNGGLNPCIIDGVEGVISVDAEENVFFTRSENGSHRSVTGKAQVITRVMQNRRNDITIVFLQELPEGYSAERYVEILERMRDYHSLEEGGKCFYVISPILNTDEENSAELDGLLEAAFGEYYINAREYLCGRAIEKYNMRVRSEEDAEAVAGGEVCSLFLSRDGQLNLYGMYAIAQYITEKFNENDIELLGKRYIYEDEE
ncbi:MAG: hypothetical protein LUD81_10960 [Clostridiales bacterium]|nr:hypothetical protein [Clostridiales bacterium]